MNSCHDNHIHSCDVHVSNHQYSLINEIICHLPYAIFSACMGIIVVSILTVLGSLYAVNDQTHAESLDLLFHSFHFLHLVFAATGALITFSRFSKNIVKGMVVSFFSSIFFCTLSDIILPYAAGMLFGVPMELHLCFFGELHNVIPFVVIGLLNGFVMSKHNSATKAVHSVVYHFTHILVSCLASLFYMVGQGFYEWHEQMGLIFFLLILVVIIPCTLADLVVPLFFARVRKGHEKH